MSFVLTTCAVGAEAVLRRWMPEHRGWRAAFSRPGLITWKVEGAVDAGLPRPHPLFRTWGVSLGFCTAAPELGKALDQLEAPVLQVMAGEAGPKGHVPETVLERWEADVRRVEEEIRTCWGARVRGGDPAIGEAVLDVVVRPGEPWMVGWHRHTRERGPLPGGAWELAPPADAPSRAWAKLEEMIRWSGLTPGKGESALEIGCAPGGATMALLDRGLRVCSVDPLPIVLPERLRQAPFLQHRCLIEKLPRDQFPAAVDWIVVDMGLSAPMAVHHLARIVPRYRDRLQGLFVTLKLNEWTLVERLPELLDRIAAMGFDSVEAACLPAFRQELGVVARRR
ncbi:MAG: hypothetical protein FDZ69_12230 [Deltaproteobacteria bacterium]|nr:MAG: hypothetical protein FDZ69_12230 [Deltaproteobacteria bacterium]